MAKLIDSKPGYKGEQKVWEKLGEYLPAQDIVYSNREVNGFEYDDCVLMEGKGLLIIEVKGWKADDIYQITNSGEIFLAGEAKGKPNPIRQARGYRFKLINLLNSKLNINPLVMDMVCYPNITENQYHETQLDKLTDEVSTIFADDLENAVALNNKISRLYERSKVSNHDVLDHKMFVKIRYFFEPNYNLKNDIVDLNPGYSRLRIYSESPADEQVNEIIDEYFKGIKEYIFVPKKDDLLRLATAVENKLHSQGIQADRNNVFLSKETSDLSKLNRNFSIFNFEIDVLETVNEFTDQDIVIEEGNCSDEQAVMLKNISDITEFNYQQFAIEHAPENTNILVTAGAGTGKTYSMVSRVAFLCNKVIDPIVDITNDICMITFTNDAADNMKNRIKRLFMNYFVLTKNDKYLRYIDSIPQMQISTIHKFAIMLLRKACLKLGLGHDFQITSEIYNRRRIYHDKLNSYISSRLDDNPDFSDQMEFKAYELEDILIDFSDKLYNKSFDVKNINVKKLGDVTGGVPYFNELIEQVIIPAETEYTNELRENNLVDLRQCMILLNEIVKDGNLDNYGLSFRYMFIDEFQDTDDIQIDTLLDLQKLFGKNCFLFIVGDIKQSIYRFRGASMSAFDRVVKPGTPWKKYQLNRNYRTDSRLLNKFDEAFKFMASANLLVYGQDDVLSSRIKKQSKNNELVKRLVVDSADENALYSTLFDELKLQVSNLKKLNNEYKLSKEEKTIAILTRYNYQITNTIRAGKSNKFNLKIEVAEGGDLYRLPPSFDLFKLTTALTHSEDTSSLVNLLDSNYIRMKNSLVSLHNMSEENKQRELTRVLDEYFMLRMGKTWQQTVSDFQTRPVLVVLREIYESFQPWQKYSADPNRQLFYRANYECLLEEITHKFRRDYLTLNMVNDFLEINITTYQEAASRDLKVKTDDIRIVCNTIHKSKGLEYGTVVLPYTYENFTNERNNGVTVDINNRGEVAYCISKQNHFEIYNSKYNSDEEKVEHSREEARILYVGMTRAIRNLIWIKRTQTDKGNSWGEILDHINTEDAMEE